MLPLMAEVKRTVYYRITDLGRDALAGSLDGDGRGGPDASEICPAKSSTCNFACCSGWPRESR